MNHKSMILNTNLEYRNMIKYINNQNLAEIAEYRLRTENLQVVILGAQTMIYDLKD